MSSDAFTGKLMDILNKEADSISSRPGLRVGGEPPTPGSDRVAYGISDEDKGITWKYPYWSRWLNLFEQWRQSCEPGLQR